MRIASIRMVLVILNLISLMPACLAADWGTLQPLMVIPEKSVLQETFSKSGPVNKTNWQSRQGTRWSIEQGVLRGDLLQKNIRQVAHITMDMSLV